MCAAALATVFMLCWMDEIMHPGQPSLKVMLYWFLPFLYGSANGGEALCTSNRVPLFETSESEDARPSN